MIKSRREGIRYRAFYPTGRKFPEKEKYKLTDLQIAILDNIRENEGITQTRLASLIKEKKQTINYNIKVLEKIGKIRVRKKGRETHCYIAEQKQNS